MRTGEGLGGERGTLSREARREEKGVQGKTELGPQRPTQHSSLSLSPSFEFLGPPSGVC